MIRKEGLRVPIFVALIASVALSFELLQTRVLSALYFNNVVYMTVTIALLGFGLSGVLASLIHRRVKNPKQIAAYCALGLSISILLCIYIASSLPSSMADVSVLYKMILSYYFLVIPFLFAGGALSLIFMSYGKDIFQLYFFDLCASAIAAVLFCLLLWPLGAPHYVWLCSAVALSAFFLLLPPSSTSRHELVLFLSLFGLAYFFIGQKIIDNQPEHYKATAPFFNPLFDAKLEASAWTNIAKIDVFSNQTRDLWTGTYWGHPSNFMFISQDNDAPTIINDKKIIKDINDLVKEGKPDEALSVVYFMKPKAPEVLVIGVGGGIDILDARAYGSDHIDGVEINPATINLVTKRFRDYAEWPKWPNIHIYNSEGRHFIRNSHKNYDIIVMHGIDTFSALNSGAYVLTENYLYTVEAIRDYLNDLKTNGMMVIYRWFFLQPRESLRLANLFVTAAPMVGNGPANQRIMIINHRMWAATFIKREPFTQKEIDIAAKLVRENKEYAWIYVPKVLGSNQKAFEEQQFQRFHDKLARARTAFEAVINAPNQSARENFINLYPYKIDAVYDDKPFFFEYYKGKVKNLPYENWQMHGFNDSSANFGQVRGPMVHYVLYILLALTTMVSAIAMGIPLFVFERRGIKIPNAVSLINFFSSLGIGFIFLEIGCMQLLNLYLGGPMYSLAVVLAGLLFFAGLGSLLAGKSSLNSGKKLAIGMLGTAILIPLWFITMKWVMPLSEHLATSFRIGVVLASLFPLGLCMGIPFATGLKHLSEQRPEFIPWAWGINGLTSVAASILAIIFAMKFGFTMVLVLSSLVYMMGYLASWRYFSYNIQHDLNYSPLQENTVN